MYRLRKAPFGRSVPETRERAAMDFADTAEPFVEPANQLPAAPAASGSPEVFAGHTNELFRDGVLISKDQKASISVPPQ